jgi:CubicO group peptidase (beta-lactamase class C family)
MKPFPGFFCADWRCALIACAMVSSCSNTLQSHVTTPSIPPANSVAPTAATLSTTMNQPSLSRAARADLDRQLHAVVSHSEPQLASLSAVAIRGGRVVYSNAFGNAFIHPTNPDLHRAATPDSIYRIASISKLIVSLGVVALVDAGQLDLDRDISEYLGYSLRNPHFPNDRISLRMLVTHTSSLRDACGYNFGETVDLRDVLLPGGSRYGKGEMWSSQRAPGGYFHYCNFAWGIIATAMERATGERFDRLMQRVLFAPLKVTASFDPAQLSENDLARVATLYRKRVDKDGKETWQVNGPWIAHVDDYSTTAPKPRASAAYRVGTNGSVYAPQGGLRISANDLARVMLMLMNEGELDGERVLSKAAVALLLAEQWRYDKTAFGGKGNRADDDEGEGGLFNAWALGPQRFLDVSGKARGDRLVEGGGFTGFGHLGNAYGLTSAFAFDPKTKNGMIFLVGGVASNPDKTKGRYSAFYPYEEQILTALFRSALQ